MATIFEFFFQPQISSQFFVYLVFIVYGKNEIFLKSIAKQIS